MFSPALGRAVRSTAPSSCTLGRVSAAQQTLALPTVRQRRLSSSKASIPPNGANSPKSSAADSASKTGSKKVAAKGDKKKAAPAPALNLPSVPPTTYLDKNEVRLSSFFSLHRPISVDNTFPDVATMAKFNSIFEAQAPYNRRGTMNNINTLSGHVGGLETILRAHEQKNSAQNVHHLDGAPQEVSLDQLMAQLRPFHAPPAPAPMDEPFKADMIAHQEEKAADIPVSQRAWSTHVVVTEQTDAHGNRTYSTTTAPMIEIEAPNAELDDIEIRQPFLQRMRQRQRQNTRSDMFAISVKRQRKLKMKKHKYKKLMKRTRLLRRKLDRL